MRSMWLCRKPKRKWALRTNVVRDRDDGVPPRVEFGIFEPKADRKVADGTVTRARATYEHGSCYCQYLPAHVFIFPMIGTSWVAVHGSLVSWVHNGWRPASPTPTGGCLGGRLSPAGWRVVLARRRLPPVSIPKCGWGVGSSKGSPFACSGQPPFVPHSPFGVGAGGPRARVWRGLGPSLSTLASSRIFLVQLASWARALSAVRGP